MRVIVAGGGIMGLCAAWALHRAGDEPVLFEQGPLPNPLASSTDQHRLIRFAYGAMTGYARMVQEAYGAWRRLFADLGQSHYRPTGTLVVAREEDGWVAQSARCLQDLGVALERWDGAELARRLPFLDLAGTCYGLFTPSGGALFAERILRDLAGWLGARGVALHDRTPVRAVDPARALIRTADGREHRADLLVIAAGPWAPQLLPALAGRVTPSRQVAVYLEPPEDRLAAWQAAPMVLDQIEATAGGFYAVPPVDGTALKVGDHGFSLRGHPDHERAPTPAEVAAICALAETRLRDFGRYRVSAARTCFYAVAAQERFIVERCEQAWILAGFSGHGFKFGALIGERVAAAVGGGLGADALTAWAAGRT
ncbi:MAG TPA: FAD-dependent oxidoreductase [Geminicoccaceae bacterium]|nr:FAD-dependent oxidoreductase [Geminicoccaceae bacterium]